MTPEERAEKKRTIEDGVVALLPKSVNDRVRTDVIVLKSGMTKVISRRRLKRTDSGEQGSQDLTS